MARGIMQRLQGGSGSSIAPGNRSSILEHLRVLLNARRGGAESVLDFGVPDFTDHLHNVPNALLELQIAIQQTIERYEPRLQQVVVRAVDLEPVSLSLCFEVTGRLATAGQPSFRCTTRIGRRGRVLVE